MSTLCAVDVALISDAAPSPSMEYQKIADKVIFPYSRELPLGGQTLPGAGP
tara:strand:- start:396 stop:548 length:153 start_codon:yes stop_codon:yes gene_type:complete